MWELVVYDGVMDGRIRVRSEWCGMEDWFWRGRDGSHVSDVLILRDFSINHNSSKTATGSEPPSSSFFPLSGKRSAASLVERLKKVEDECKLKEDERVSLELELTEVKESLKKALSGGVTLGLTIEPKSGTSSPQVRPQSITFIL